MKIFLGLFNAFISRSKKEDASKGLISVEFTEEEIEAINKNLEAYRSFAAEKGGLALFHRQPIRQRIKLQPSIWRLKLNSEKPSV